MPNTHADASPAFLKLVEQGKQASRKHALKSSSTNTDPERLLDEPRARALRHTRNTFFQGKCATGTAASDTKSNRLSPADHDTLRRVLGGGGYRKTATAKDFSCLASNPHGRAVFTDEAYARLQHIHAREDVQMYFATIVDKAWCLPRGTKSLDLTSIKRRTEEALRAIGWDGILFLEVQVVTNLAAGRFLAHLHGIVWKRRKCGLPPAKARELLNKRSVGVGRAKGADLRLMPRQHPKALPTRFFYATKLPDTAKTHVLPDANGCALVNSSQGRLKTAHANNYTNRDALRIARLLSQHEIDKTAIAIGEGTKVRKAASAKLTAKVTAMRRPLPDPTPARCQAVFSKILRDCSASNRGEVR